MPIELTREVLELMGWDEINEITSSNQAERNTTQIKTLEGELESTRFSPEGKKSLEGDIEKLKRTGRIPKEAGTKIDFGDMETDTKKIDVDSITPTLTPELRSFLGLDKEGSIQVAARDLIDTRGQKAMKDAGVGTIDHPEYGDPQVEPTPPSVQPKDTIKYIDKEQEKRYLERRKLEEQKNKPSPSTPKPTPEQLQEIEDEKYRRRQQESLKHLQS